jgi:hypothetical protein
MKITKNYLRKVIKEQLDDESKNSDVEFYLVYDDSGMMFPPKILTSREEVKSFMENSDYDTHDFVVVPMDRDSILSIKRAK